jgi:hypothetical protein
MSGVKFENKHSYNDFGLILISKNIPPPEPKLISIDIPGGDGSIDLSTVLTNGEMKYKNRLLLFELVITDSLANKELRKSEIYNFLHGKNMKIILDWDEDFYYFGRTFVSEINDSRGVAILKIQVDAEPYKYDISETFHDINVNGFEAVDITNKKMRVIPTFECSNDMEVHFNERLHQLFTGKQKIIDISFTEGENTLEFVGNGIVSISFRGGSL